jgi:hypothetical protein
LPIEIEGSLSPVVLLTTPGKDCVSGTSKRVFENGEDELDFGEVAELDVAPVAATRNATAATKAKRLCIG